jgi:hypothetical protein
MSLRSPVVYDVRVRTYMEFIEKCIITTPEIKNHFADVDTVSLLKSIEANTLRELFRQEDKHRCFVQLALLTQEEFTTLHNKHEAEAQSKTSTLI